MDCPWGISGSGCEESKSQTSLLLLSWELDILSETEGTEDADDHPGRVQLPPLEAMPC